MEPEENPKNPPVIELVLSVQFEPIKFSTGIFADIWKTEFNEFKFVEDAIAVDDYFENFGDKTPSPSSFQLLTVEKVIPRFILSNTEGDRLLQFQSTRFFCNWRKKEGSEYPDYKEFSNWFHEKFSCWQSSLLERDIRVIPNQFELTYVDAFFKNDLWKNLSDWHEALPGLFSEIGNNDIAMKMSNRAAQWSFELPNKFGRLHVSAKYGSPKLDFLKEASALMLNTTVRGPLTEREHCMDVFSKAHEIAVTFFKSVTSEKVKRRCP